MIDISLYIIDTRNKKIDEDELHRFLSNEDISLLSKYKNEQTRLEKIVSLYLKRKYIGEYYLSKGRHLQKTKQKSVLKSRRKVNPFDFEIPPNLMDMEF